MGRRFAKIWQEEKGQSLTEYALFLVLICLVAVGSVKKLASAVTGAYFKTTGSVMGDYTPPVPASRGHLLKARQTHRSNLDGHTDQLPAGNEQDCQNKRNQANKALTTGLSILAFGWPQPAASDSVNKDLPLPREPLNFKLKYPASHLEVYGAGATGTE